MRKSETIASAVNPLLKEVRKAIIRGTLTSRGCCVAESFHLLEEALRSHCRLDAVIAAESAWAGVEARLRSADGVRSVVLEDRLFQSLASTENSQGVIALVEPPVWTMAEIFSAPALAVVLDGLQDPGNAGAIARTAEAFGATGVLFLKGSVNPFNPKTLRASAGSLFRIPFLYALDEASALAALHDCGARLYAAVPARAGIAAGPLQSVDFRRNCAVAIGSEAHGVSAALRAAAFEVTIPTARVESLNAAVAAGILLYEARRQRSLAG